MRSTVKKIFTFLIWIIFSLYIAIAMLPKTEIYYKLEHILAPFNIYINSEKTTDNLLAFHIDNAKIIYRDIESAQIDNIKISTFIFYNSIKVSPFSLKDELANFIPPRVDYINIKNTVLRPHILTLESKGDFGTASGYVNLMTRKAHVDFVFSSTILRKYKSMLRMLKKTKEGYMYEYSF